MESNKRITWTLTILLGATLACSLPFGTASSSTRMPTEVDEEPLNQDLVQPSIPGLYLPYGTRLEGDIQRAVISSRLSCARLFSVLEGGEWRMTRRITLPGMGDPQYLALLERGEAQLYVRASPISRAFESAATGVPTATPETPTIIPTGLGDYCVAVVQAVSRQSLRAQGQVTLAGEALQFPFCSSSNGQVSLALSYQSPDNVLTMLKAKFPAQIGEHNLVVEDELTLDVLQNLPGLFDFYAQLALVLANSETDQSTVTSLNFSPGQDFSGKVTLTSLTPLVGKLFLNGLVTEESEAPQSFEAGFACTPPDSLPKDMVDLRPIERPEVSLSLDMHFDLGPADYMGFTETATVHLEGVLKAESPDTYSGQWLATGQGSFSSFGSDLKPCTNTWTGKQLLQLDGRLAGGNQLVLTFSPAGQPQVQFENSCGIDMFDPGFLPVDNAQLRGNGSLDLAWPPDAAGNARQTVDGHLPGSGDADFGTWQAVFEN